jgi:hypothetical protein
VPAERLAPTADLDGNVTNGRTSYYGSWYDQLDANENGDKCAYVGLSPPAGVAGPNILPVPGAMGDIQGAQLSPANRRVSARSGRRPRCCRRPGARTVWAVVTQVA